MKLHTILTIASLLVLGTLPSWAIVIPGFDTVDHPMGNEFYVSRENPKITVLVKRETSSEMVDLVKATPAEQKKFLEITSTIRAEVNKSIGLNDWQIQAHKIVPQPQGHIFEFEGSFTDYEGQKIEFLERQFRTTKGYVKIYAKKPQSANWPQAFENLAKGLGVWRP